METLRAGVQYGLSSQNTFYDNKELIFVKLTDSAQRAIDTYLRNQNNFDKKPTIQFHGSKGQLFFPSDQSNHSIFSFSLSNYLDGGFECIQQTGPENLESLGTLPCKMQIQANDDVYETTRHRLHVANENSKNKCTQVLKANEVVSKKTKSVRKAISKFKINPSSKLQQTINSRRPSKISPKFSSTVKTSNSNFNNSHLKTNNKSKLKDAASKIFNEKKKEAENYNKYNLPSPEVEKINKEDIDKITQKPSEVNNYHPVSFDSDIRGETIKQLSNFYYDLQEKDCYKDYTTIINYEQRCRYKDEYSIEFEEYNRLQPLVYKITEHFSRLKEELARKQSCNDTKGYKVLEEQIWVDYLQTKNIKARHHHLYCKLEHIAKLINEFDSRVSNG